MNDNQLRVFEIMLAILGIVTGVVFFAAIIGA